MGIRRLRWLAGLTGLLVGLGTGCAGNHVVGAAGLVEVAGQPLDTTPLQLAVGDFDGDQQQDVAILGLQSQLCLLRGNGQLGFALPSCSGLAAPASHLVALATGGLELGAMSPMFLGFATRESILTVFEQITGLRMNHAYIRPGGVAQDLPDGSLEMIISLLDELPDQLGEVEALLTDNYIWKARTQGVGYLDLAGCMALGVTGPCLRSTGLPHDLRRSAPYCGYETYEFDVPTVDTCDSYGRYLIRVAEMHQSLRIARQCVERLAKPGPITVDDQKLGWPADLQLGPDGLGNSPEHIAKIMGQSMESLIHHFKLVTEGFRVPAGQCYTAIESPRGELGVHMVSDGGTRPYRVHFRDPSFTNLQAVAAMCEGGMVADVITAVASIDPVMGGVDR